LLGLLCSHLLIVQLFFLRVLRFNFFFSGCYFSL
jgi:hypothetical protein